MLRSSTGLAHKTAVLRSHTVPVVRSGVGGGARDGERRVFPNISDVVQSWRWQRRAPDDGGRAGKAPGCHRRREAKARTRPRQRRRRWQRERRAPAAAPTTHGSAPCSHTADGARTRQRPSLQVGANADPNRRRRAPNCADAPWHRPLHAARHERVARGRSVGRALGVERRREARAGRRLGVAAERSVARAAASRAPGRGYGRRGVSRSALRRDVQPRVRAVCRGGGAGPGTGGARVARRRLPSHGIGARRRAVGRRRPRVRHLPGDGGRRRGASDPRDRAVAVRRRGGRNRRPVAHAHGHEALRAQPAPVCKARLREQAPCGAARFARQARPGRGARHAGDAAGGPRRSARRGAFRLQGRKRAGAARREQSPRDAAVCHRLRSALLRRAERWGLWREGAHVCQPAAARDARGGSSSTKRSSSRWSPASSRRCGGR